MDKIKLKAYGKINLGLDVIRKREDGYHELKMIMQTVSLHDTIEITKTPKSGISLKTNRKYLPTNENNLVYKAVKLLMDEFNINEGVDIDLRKIIPVAAGMAGGSSDCAAALMGINKLFQLGLSKEALQTRGVILGADVPYCIAGGTVLAEGIGDILTPLPSAPQCKVLIVKPSISVSTKFVYNNLRVDLLEHHPDIDGIVNAIKNKDLYQMSNKLENVLETVTIKNYPVIAEIKNIMKHLGAINAIMSGSGPTVFGLFDNDKMAIEAYNKIKAQNMKEIYLIEFQNKI